MRKSFALVTALGMIVPWINPPLSHARRHCWFNCPVPTEGDSWETIRSDWNVGITQPAGASTFGPFGYFNACLEGDHFRALKKTPVCVASRWVHVGGGSQAGGEALQECVRHENQYATLPLHSIRKVCLEFRHTHVGGGQETGEDIVTCVRHGEQEVTLPTSPQLTVNKYFSTGQAGAGSNIVVPQFKKTYEVPTCERPL